jgi:hypothetical protein
MPSESGDEAVWAGWHEAVEALRPPATDEEARALVQVLPRDDSSGFGLAWAVVHFIESAPNWPLADAFVEDGSWVQFLRERAGRDAT